MLLFTREDLVKAIHAAGVPEGVTGVRVDIFPKKLELQIGVSDMLPGSPNIPLADMVHVKPG